MDLTLNEVSLRVSFGFRHISFFTISESLSDMFWAMLDSFMMYRVVIRRTNDSQIFETIIIPNSVQVMYYLSIFKIPHKMSLHHQPMLTNITSIGSIRMFRRININISTPEDSSPSPLGVVLSCISPTFSGAILPVSKFNYGRGYKKCLTTLYTILINRWVMIFTLFHNNNYRLHIIGSQQ